MYSDPHDPVRRTTARPAPTLALLVGLLVLAASLYAAQTLTVPSPALPATASAALFSAERAWPLLERLVGDESPQPVGTPAGEAARERVVAEFEALGYEVELQSAWGCREEYTVCADVTNVLARLPGTTPGPALMLSAHYDSVGAGPGVADDMAAVAAIVEVAGMLRNEPQLRNDVIFLITDGEEVGLTGAEAFLDHPWLQEVGLIANFEARGTGGQSLLFQTSPDNAWLIERFAQAAPRAATSSLLYELYRLLPNDTDLTVYLEAGLPGINFAFVEGVERYHTAIDDLAHLSRDTFQHHGENVLAAVRAFGNADLGAMPPGNALYQDVLPGVVLQAPAGWAVWLAVGALVIWLLIVMALLGSGALTPGGSLLALLFTLVGFGAAALLGYGATELIRLFSGIDAPWYAYPLPSRVAVWAAGAFGFMLFASLAAGRAGFWGMASAVWLWWSAISLAVALLLPGASVTFLLPTLVGTVVYALLVLFGAGLGTRGAGPIGWLAVLLALVSVFVTGYLTLGLTYTFELGLGFEMSAALGLMVALGVSGFAPLLAVPRSGAVARGAVLVLALLTVAGGVVWALRVPTYSAEKPQRLNLSYAQLGADGEASEAHWLAETADGAALPASLQSAGGFGARRVTLPGDLGAREAAPAPELDLPLPTVEVVSDETAGDQRLLRLRLVSPRQADRMTLLVPRMAGLTLIDVEAASRSIAYPRNERDAFDLFDCRGVACDGLELTLHVNAERDFRLVLVDHTLGLPAEGEFLLAARQPLASPSGDGDAISAFNSVPFAAAD